MTTNEPINQYSQFVRGTNYKVEVFVDQSVKRREQYTYKLKKNTDTENYLKLTKEETLAHGDGAVAGKQSYTYNSNDQVREVVKYAYDYQQDGATADTFYTQEITYLWEDHEGDLNHDIYKRNLMELKKEVIVLAAEGSATTVKQEKGEKYLYDPSFFLREVQVTEPSTPGNRIWRTFEIVEAEARGEYQLNARR